jgi:hypothetical protein
MYPEACSKVCHGSFCQLGNSVSLSWVIYYGAFYLHVVSSYTVYLYPETALHVSGGTITHHQEPNNYIYGIWYLSHRYCCLPLSWKSWNCSAIVDEIERKFYLIHDSSRQQYWFDNT